MSRGLSKVQIIGNLGRDPEMRYTPSGAAVTEFSVAVNRRRRGQDGQQVDETDWYRVVCWSKLAEFADQYLKRGMRVYVDGRLQIRHYTGNDGQERTAVEVVANDVVMLTPRDDASAGPRESGGGRRPVEAEAGREDDFDDVPF
ncbi:MAG TPA: single-stranded DNA-binding protein [Thermomicrobiaceae bacterium]|nr:single-stranded DNA-binding protein [Thermomicrobiaceae bacterium]